MRTSLAAAAILSLAARPTRAEPSLALRLAVAPALGDAAAEVPMVDTVRLQLPVQADALWQLGPAAAGIYASWGYATVGACGSASCRGSVVRAGLQATWTFAPSDALRGAEPWAGVATGYEWATERRARAGSEVTTTWRGFELFAAQGGMEWRLGPRVALGPFVLAGAGRYTDVSVDTGVESASAELARKAVHAWIHLGVRGRLVLGSAR